MDTCIHGSVQKVSTLHEKIVIKETMQHIGPIEQPHLNVLREKGNFWIAFKYFVFPAELSVLIP